MCYIGREEQLFAGNNDLGFEAGLMHCSLVVYDEISWDTGLKDSKVKKMGNGLDRIVAREFYKAGTTLKSYITIFTTSQYAPVYNLKTIEGLNAHVIFIDVSDVVYTNNTEKLKKPNYHKINTYYKSPEFKQRIKNALFWALIPYLFIFYKFDKQRCLYGAQLIHNIQTINKLLPKYNETIQKYCKYTGNKAHTIALSTIINEYIDNNYRDPEKVSKQAVFMHFANYLEKCYPDLFDLDTNILNKLVIY